MAEALSPEDFIARAQALVERHQHKDQTMPRKIADGTATPESIGLMSVHFYHFFDLTPTIFGLCYARSKEADLRQGFLDNLIDEDTDQSCGDKPHWQLSLDFTANWTGLSEDEIKSHPVPLPIQDILNFRVRNASELHPAEALAVFGISGESHFSTACAVIAEGLRTHYGQSEDDVVLWSVHATGDEEHGATARRLVARYVDTAERQQRALARMIEYLYRWKYLWNLADDPGYQLPAEAAAEIQEYRLAALALAA